MPALFGGFGNLLIPVSMGSPDVAFPRFNNLSILFLVVAVVCLVSSLLLGYGLGTGWTFYAPLCTNTLLLDSASVLVALAMIGNSSTLTSVNFISTNVSTGVANELCLCSLTMLVTASLLVMVLPILLSLIILAAMDSFLNVPVFDVSHGGDVVLFQHLFWLFGHPEVYIIILPGFGLVCLSLGLLFAEISSLLAIVSLAVLGCVVWAHHMFAASSSLTSLNYFSAVTSVIACPTGVKCLVYTTSLAL